MAPFEFLLTDKCPQRSIFLTIGLYGSYPRTLVATLESLDSMTDASIFADDIMDNAREFVASIHALGLTEWVWAYSFLWGGLCFRRRVPSHLPLGERRFRGMAGPQTHVRWDCDLRDFKQLGALFLYPWWNSLPPEIRENLDLIVVESTEISQSIAEADVCTTSRFTRWMFLQI